MPASQWSCTPASFTEVATGSTFITRKPIEKLFGLMQGIESCAMGPGDYDRQEIKASSRPPGSSIASFIGATKAGGGSTITVKPFSGGSDSLFIHAGARDIRLIRLKVKCSPRSGIKTEHNPNGPSGATNVTLDRVDIQGNLFDPTWTGGQLWGQHHYDTADWLETGCTVIGIKDEHARYFHNIQGDHTFWNPITERCGRTAFQFVNRKSEGVGTKPKIGAGDITIEGGHTYDTCLEMGGGGSALTFRGGMPNTTITIKNHVVRLGCDPNLPVQVRGNITGGLVVDSEPSVAFPGGTKAVVIDGLDSEVGTIYPGVGSARRTNAKLASVGVVEFRRARLVQGASAFQIALDVQASVGTFVITGDPLGPDYEIVGQVKYHGITYPNWKAFVAANTGLVA